MQGLKFLIIATGYNCGYKAVNCLASVLNQTYVNYTAVFISDGSTDNTSLIVDSFKGKDTRVMSVIGNSNKGAAYRRHQAINSKALSVDPETVILFLGLDDELLPNALETIKAQYDAGKWMTYGNWKDQNHWMLHRDFLEFDEVTHANRDYRKVKYRSTAPNTFKKFLYDNIHQCELMFNGNWIKATTESHVMFSCMEMCGKEKIGVIYDPIYLYNRNTIMNARSRFGSDYQDAIYLDIISRDKKHKIQ